VSEIKLSPELKEITAFCRKFGIEFIKMGDFELRLREEAPPSNYKRKKLEVVPDKPETQLTNEDYLLWSVQEDEVADG
jgi:hypothetical protein